MPALEVISKGGMVLGGLPDQVSGVCVRREVPSQSKGNGQETLDGGKGLVRKLALEFRFCRARP